MTPEDIEVFCKKISRTNDSNYINQQLTNFSEEDLIDLANGFRQQPFNFKLALAAILDKLFEDTREFADLLNKYFEKTCGDPAKGILHEPLREEIIKQQNKTLCLVKRMVHLGDRPGISAGILLSWIVEELDEAENFMVNGFTSENLDVNRCALVAFSAIICNSKKHVKRKYLDVLKIISSDLAHDNLYHLIVCLQCAYEKLPNEFESVLIDRISSSGFEGAKQYILFAKFRPKVSISTLQKAIEILESETIETDIIDIGLAELYELNQNFVIEKLKNRLLNRSNITIADEHLLHKINEIGSEPVLRMIESQIDEGNPILLNIGESILEDFFPNFSDNSDWVAWCEYWKDDLKKETIIIMSLRLILSKLINYNASEVRNRAISLVKHFAVRKAIDYDIETKQINYGNDSTKGNYNKENTVKALSIIEKIRYPISPIESETLSHNLKNAPNLSEVINAKWLIKNASSQNPHPLAYIFHEKCEEGGLTTAQEYWENVFSVLKKFDIQIGKGKLHDSSNALSILAEAEVFSRLAPFFDKIIPEPDIPVLKPKKLEALIEHDGEKALIEVRTVYEKLDETLPYGVVWSTKGSKVKSVLLDKFNNQLKEGKADPECPIVIILCLGGFINLRDVHSAIYGEPQYYYKKNNNTNEIVEEGIIRKENGFYDEDGTEMVTAIGAYRRDYLKKDPLIGKLYHPHKYPINKMSLKFKLKLRTALFGNSESSNWDSLMRISAIDERAAKLFYENGIEDIGILANIQDNEYIIDGFPNDKLLQLKKEARRINDAISTSSIMFLKGMDQKTFNIFTGKGIYLINKMLEFDAPPEGIASQVWISLIDDAKNILSS